MNTPLLNQSVQASFNGTQHFGEIVGHLTREGVEWYSANLFFRLTSYYYPDGSHHQVPWPKLALPPIADAFDGAKITAAIRSSQQGKINYPEFLGQSAQAGIVYYTVHLKGKKALYFGRHGDFHVELFPKPKE